MTVLAFGRSTPLRTAALAARLLAHRDPGKLGDVEVWQGVERLRVTAEPAAWYQADGELLGRAATLEIERVPQRLLVIGAGTGE